MKSFVYRRALAPVIAILMVVLALFSNIAWVSADTSDVSIKDSTEETLSALGITMVAIPGGSFQMGCSNSDLCESNELPLHNVSISAFNMSSAEVTFDQWDACVADGGCSYRPDDEGWKSGRGNRPVIYVSYRDITEQFIPWLNKITQANFRLPTEAEWEYAARAGARTAYSFGNSEKAVCQYANGLDQTMREHVEQPVLSCNDGYEFTAPVGSFKSNHYGLFDMHGNVFEWTQDCWNESYLGAPANGQAWRSGDCGSRVLRGGAWFFSGDALRSAYRHKLDASFRGMYVGFRVVQEL